jgi:hypothetical protein
MCNLGFRSLSSSCVEVIVTFCSTQESLSSGQARRKENAARYVSLALEIREGGGGGCEVPRRS